jgi:hypothetical protein
LVQGDSYAKAGAHVEGDGNTTRFMVLLLLR